MWLLMVVLEEGELEWMNTGQGERVRCGAGGTGVSSRLWGSLFVSTTESLEEPLWSLLPVVRLWGRASGAAAWLRPCDPHAGPWSS